MTFKVGDYVYDTQGDEAKIISINQNPFGDKLFEVEYYDYTGFAGTDTVTECELTAASDVESI